MPATLPFMMIGPPELPSSILPVDPDVRAGSGGNGPLDHPPLARPLTEADGQDVFSPSQHPGTPTQRLDLLGYRPVTDDQVAKTSRGVVYLQRSNLRGDRSPLVMIERDLWLRIAFNHVGRRRYVDRVRRQRAR